MIGRWRPSERSRCRGERGLGPAAVLGAELDRVGRRGPDGKLAGAVEGDDRAVEPDVDLDEAAGIAPPTATRRQLEDPPVEVDRVVAGDPAAVLEDEDPVEPDVGRDHSPGRQRIRSRDGEAGVEAGQEGGQQLVGASPVSHPGQPELDDEAVLERAP